MVAFIALEAEKKQETRDCEPLQNTQRQRRGPAGGVTPKAWAATLENCKALGQELMVWGPRGARLAQRRGLPALFYTCTSASEAGLRQKRTGY